MIDNLASGHRGPSHLDLRTTNHRQLKLAGWWPSAIAPAFAGALDFRVPAKAGTMAALQGRLQPASFSCRWIAQLQLPVDCASPSSAERHVTV